MRKKIKDAIQSDVDLGTVSMQPISPTRQPPLDLIGDSSILEDNIANPSNWSDRNLVIVRN